MRPLWKSAEHADELKKTFQKSIGNPSPRGSTRRRALQVLAMDVILHIGTPKTGTTAIQALFFRNRSKLLRESGVCPTESGLVQKAHHNIAYQFGGMHLKNFHPRRGGLEQALEEARAQKASI